MSRVRVCSGFSPAGHAQYGQRFLDTFDFYWPKDVELQVYVEEPIAMPRGACRDLWSIPGARECQAYYGPAKFHGRVPMPNWKPSAVAAGYNFKFDAAKFWKQIVIPQAASIGLDDGDILVWLDGDVETIAPVPFDFVERTIRDFDVAFLGREPKHSEIGFWAVRINDKARPFLENMAACYTTGAVLNLREWHSAYVWDEARIASEMMDSMRCRNICSPGARGHVWPLTELAKYTDHKKGKRKAGGTRG